VRIWIIEDSGDVDRITDLLRQNLVVERLSGPDPTRDAGDNIWAYARVRSDGPDPEMGTDGAWESWDKPADGPIPTVVEDAAEVMVLEIGELEARLFSNRTGGHLNTWPVRASDTLQSHLTMARSVAVEHGYVITRHRVDPRTGRVFLAGFVPSGWYGGAR
jgi:hypothetical protein